jgi:hypothetical protein
MDTPQKWREVLWYAVWGSLLWLIVDFGSAGGFRIAYYEQYAPTICLFYIIFPVIFSYLAIGRGWGWKRLLAATLIEIFLVEGLFVQNPLILNFPVLLIGIPLAIGIYAPLTFFPLWIVRRTVGQHKRVVLLLTTVVVLVSLLSTFGQQRAW